MMRITPIAATVLCLALSAARPAVAQSDAIWACVDEQGHKVFQNVGNGKGCRRIDGLIATIPGTTPSQPPAAGSSQRGVSPASFPRIDQDTQRVRDSDRRRILEDELRVEQARLAHLRDDLNGGTPRLLADETAESASYRERVQRMLEDVQRSESYIASLKRELTPPRY